MCLSIMLLVVLQTVNHLSISKYTVCDTTLTLMVRTDPCSLVLRPTCEYDILLKDYYVLSLVFYYANKT